jgi:hypothetical protein
MSEAASREIQRLRGEIEAWRRERNKRAPLPEHLWAAAVSVAHQVGVNRARLALGLSYRGLQSHVERANSAPEFVEISGAEVLAAAPSPASATSIEIAGRDVHVVVRLGNDRALDVASLVAAVRGRP